jgi:GxxExxY protein
VNDARDPQSHAVIGAAMEVHNTLGHGFLEAVYLNALCLELASRQIPFRREVPIPVYYKEVKLACGYRVDFLCYGSLLVEIKAQVGLTDIDDAQVINYLRATDCERALLLNFGTARLQYRRLVLTKERREDMLNEE